jgi:hypothetical protein
MRDPKYALYDGGKFIGWFYEFDDAVDVAAELSIDGTIVCDDEYVTVHFA